MDSLSKRKKQLRGAEQGHVLDQQGRRRLHGAFSGGFSAGYFNTVGSQEGWTPQSFVSSRSDRTQQKKQSAFDFMDEEDGLLGGKLQAKEDYDTFSSATLSRVERLASLVGESGGVIPGPLPGELISVAPSARPIGYKLLQQLGWREGQAIGRRKKRRLTKPDDGVLATSSSTGLVIPEGVDITQLPSQAFNDKKEDGNEAFENITFAPRVSDNVGQVKKLKAKRDGFGLGYDPSAPTTGLSGSASDMLALQTSRNKYKNSLEGAGSGAYHTDNIKNGGSSGWRGGVSQRDQGGFAIFDDEDDVYDDSVNPTSSALSNTTGYKQESGKRSSMYHSLNESSLFRIESSVDNSWNSANSSGALDFPGTKLYIRNDDDRDTSNHHQLSLPVKRCTTDNKPPLTGFVVQQTITVLRPDRFPLPKVPSTFKEYHTFPIVAKKDAESSSEPLVGSGAVYDMLDARGKEQYNRALRAAAQFSGTNEAQTKAEYLRQVADKEKGERKILQQSAFSLGLGEALRNRFTTSTSSDESVMQKQVAARSLSSSFKPSSSKSNIASPPLKEGEIRVLSNKGSRTTSAWQPSRLLCKRMNVPVPTMSTSINDLEVSDSKKKDGESNKREKELYEAHVGRYLTGTTEERGILDVKSSGSNEKMLTIVSGVTGDFELVPESQHLAKKSPEVSQSTSSNFYREQKESEMMSTSERGDSSIGEKGEAFVEPVSKKSAEELKSVPAVIPSLSLFQSIFCSESDSESSEDESDDDADSSKEGRGNVDKDDDGFVSNCSKEVHIATEKDTEINVNDETPAPLPEAQKVLFRKPDRLKNVPPNQDGNVMHKTEKKRKRQAALSFQEFNSEDEDNGVERLKAPKNTQGSDKKRIMEPTHSIGAMRQQDDPPRRSHSQTLISKIRQSLNADLLKKHSHADSDSTGGDGSSDTDSSIELRQKKHKKHDDRKKHKSKKKKSGHHKHRSSHKSSKKKKKSSDRH